MLLIATGIAISPQTIAQDTPGADATNATDTPSTPDAANTNPATDGETQSPPADPAAPQSPKTETSDDTANGSNTVARESTTGPVLLRFDFERTPWRDVIDWLADEADLALYVGEVPTGSFTYNDSSEFTVDGAIDRVNLFLLSEGFTIVRRGQLMSVINLSDPRGMQQMQTMAQLVSADQLDDFSQYDVVRCLFRLGDLKAEDAVEELRTVRLLTQPNVFTKTNQLMITDTVGRLKEVRAILKNFEPRALENGTIVKNFALQHTKADDILVVARPHLGLATDEMIGIDVSISTDLQGRNIFVTGVDSKVKLMETLIEALDKPDVRRQMVAADAKLQSHYVEGGNVEMVYNVLQTMLNGRQVRLSMDEDAGTIVALADAKTQAEITATVTELQATDETFEVIPLRTIDPYFAITLLDQMLDLPQPFDDPDEIDPDAPKIDADPANMRLFVRAKKPIVDQVREIVEKLDQGQDTSTDS
ncbi:MAG: secretin N-terminal domain-containing protein, partial [Planctomycetota bacterium]